MTILLKVLILSKFFNSDGYKNFTLKFKDGTQYILNENGLTFEVREILLIQLMAPTLMMLSMPTTVMIQLILWQETIRFTVEKAMTSLMPETVTIL